MAALGLLAACAVSPQAPESVPVLGEEVFTVGFTRIAEVYFQPVDSSRLAVDGVRGLAAIEPDLAVDLSGGALRVRLGPDAVAELPAPPPDDARRWAHATAQAVAEARAASPRLRRASMDEIYDAVFAGITGDLDGYSRYLGVQSASREREDRDGYGGIGVVVDRIDGALVVRAARPDGPAAASGVRPGDAILAVDGIDTGWMSERDLSLLLRGEAGSRVVVDVAGPAEPPRRLELVRAMLVPETVSLGFDDGIAILRVERFNAATASGVRHAIEAALAAPGGAASGFVLDLRGNPGGLLDQAVAVADVFMPRGAIVSTAGRHPKSLQHYDALLDDAADGRPLVVLVDGRSASAAEVVAAALQDTGRAVVVGTSSYGKGSVQAVTRLPNDGELFLTWSRIYSPGGYSLHRQGVLPTICTSRSDAPPLTILAQLRDGTYGMPATLATWRVAAPDDDDALGRLREICPLRAVSVDLDVEIAVALLREPGLYRRALSLLPAVRNATN